MEFNENQKKAINFYKGCCNVIASAGSGKTGVLVYRIQNMVLNHDVDPNRILAITFSKKAKENMMERLEKLLPEHYKYLHIETFHSFGYSIVRRFNRMGYTILDSDWKKNKIIEDIFKDLFRMPEVKGNLIVDCTSYISTQKNHLKYPNKNSSEDFERVYYRYEKYKRDKNILDFDDMLTMAYEILRDNEKALAHCQKQYEYILADEMQDTNTAQYEIIRLIAEKNQNVFFVDDPLQCWDGNCDVRLENGEVKKVQDLKVGDYVETAFEKKSYYSPITNISVSTNSNMFELETESGLKISTTQNHRFYVGNPYFSDNSWYLYLMYRKDKGFRIGITNGGLTKSIQARVASEHPERLWIINVYDNKSTAGYYENYYSLKYQIPTIPYFNIGRQIRLTQTDINLLFYNFGDNGKQFLFDNYMNFDFPNYVTQDFKDSNNQFSTIKLTSNVVNNKNVVSYEKDYNNTGLRIRKVFSKFKDAYIYANELKIKYNADMIVERMSADNRRMFNVVCANNITPMMEILIMNDGVVCCDRVKSVKKIHNPTQVYDIEIEQTGNMVANGIVSHNCIYCWRDSDNKYVLNFDSEWDNNTTIINLNCNYRSSKDIVSFANKFATTIPESKHKYYVESISDKGNYKVPEYCEYIDEKLEASKIAQKVKEFVDNEKYQFRNIAILARTNAQLANFESAMHKYTVPYVIVDGIPFVERKEIKIILAYLKLSCDMTNNKAFEYIYNKPNRYLGKAFLDDVKKESIKTGNSYFYSMHSVAGKNRRYAKGVGDLSDIINYLNKVKFKTVRERIDYIRRWTKLDEYVSDESSDDNNSCDKIDNLNTLADIAEDFISAADFVEYMGKLVVKNKDTDDAIKLMTIHKSKGLEFPVVFIVGVNENILPHHRNENIDEERRLMYVAITRAEKELYISSTEHYGRKATNPSCFVHELFD